jgi:predicted ester cyclase
MMSTPEIRQFLQRYVEAVTADFEAGLERYVADESLKEHGRFFQSAFPGYRIEPVESIAEDNKIAVYAMLHCTHNGPLNGIEPTGKEVSAPFMIMYFVEDEKIVRHYIVLDEMAIMEELGSLPPAPA